MRRNPGRDADESFELEPAWSDGIGPEKEESGERRVPLARFGNVAEAGYFADELTSRLEFPVTVHAEPAFDALHHVWQTRYWLLVPEGCREKGALALQELIDETRHDDADHDPGAVTNDQSWSPTRYEPDHGDRFDIEPGPTAGGTVNWVPIVLTLTAGSAALFALRWYEDAHRQVRRPPPGPMVDLWNTLSERPGSWTQSINEGRGVRELRLDRRRGVAVLREDADGDGRAEFEREIPHPMPEWRPRP